jgi:hypothetical protein
MTKLNPEQQALLVQYHQAHAAWISASAENFEESGEAWMRASDACIAAGFDPFHYPAPLPY